MFWISTFFINPVTHTRNILGTRLFPLHTYPQTKYFGYPSYILPADASEDDLLGTRFFWVQVSNFFTYPMQVSGLNWYLCDCNERKVEEYLIKYWSSCKFFQEGKEKIAIFPSVIYSWILYFWISEIFFMLNDTAWNFVSSDTKI